MVQPGILRDNRGQVQRSPAAAAADVIVALTVTGLVAAFLIPIAIGEIVAVDTSGWGSEAVAIWGIMDLGIVLGVMIAVLTIALAETERL